MKSIVFSAIGAVTLAAVAGARAEDVAGAEATKSVKELLEAAREAREDDAGEAE